MKDSTKQLCKRCKPLAFGAIYRWGEPPTSAVAAAE